MNMESNKDTEIRTVAEVFMPDENIQVLFYMSKKDLECLKGTASIFNKAYSEIIREAVKKHLDKLNDISYLDDVLKDNVVDSIIARLKEELKEERIDYLTPKAIHKIYAFFKAEYVPSIHSLPGIHKWEEFCMKMGISKEIKEKVEKDQLNNVICFKWRE